MKLVQRTVYFRPEDIELWNAIDNKAQWLHERLKADVYGTPSIFKESPTKDTSPSAKMLVGSLRDFNKPTGKCGHTLDSRGKCLTKGCKGK